jgi:hypothetical protein
MVPFVYDPNLDHDKNEEQGIASGAPQIAQGSSSNEAPAASGSTPTAKKELNTGSSFQNIDKYLSTNQSQQFGNQVLGKVGDTLNTAKQNQADASQAFNSQVQSANYTPDQEKINQSLNKPEEANAKDFQKWMSQSYQGPKSLAEDQSDWNKYWSGTNQAQAQSKALGSDAGRFSLLDSYFGRPAYNFGEKSLDNLLVQQSGLGKETRDLQNQAAQLKSQGQAQATGLQNLAANRAGEVEQSRKQVNDAYGQAQTGAQDAISQATQAANVARMNEQNALRSALTSGSLSDAQLSQLGLSRGQNTYNLNLADYLSTGGALSNEQVASPEQRARINALSQLAGQQQRFLGDQLDPTASYSYDKNKMTTDAGAAQAKLNQAMDQSKATLVGLVGDDVGKGYPAANASPQEWYQYFKNYLNKRDSGQPVFRMGGEPDIRRAVSEYENAMNTYNPNRRL